MDLPIFVFGTLRHDALRAAVAGSELPGRRAVLPGHAVVRALDGDGRPQPFPLLTTRPGTEAEGLLLDPAPAQRDRLHGYERLFRYRAAPVTVLCAGKAVEAELYRPESGSWVPGPDWNLADWAKDWAALRSGAAAEVMALWPDHDPALIAQRYPMIEIAVASCLRAAMSPAPAVLRRSPLPGDVKSDATRRPYARYFGVQEDDLRFRRFDGGQSDRVTRAGFILGDAVTVLPYDPVRDRVMVVEQYRYGAWLRGDPNPWSLEAVAGRIDPGETPEAAARRETVEETGLDLGDLLPVGRYYPSPGAVTEYIISYVALADLDDGAAGVGGLASEAEDIRAHVIGFDRLMGLIDSGEVENAPLLISAQWLAARRDRIRAGLSPGVAPEA